MWLRFMYFIYYVACRRDQVWLPTAHKPAVTATSIMFFFGWPVLAFLALLNHFTHWLAPWTHW